MKTLQHFQFTEVLNFINDNGEIETNYCNIYPQKLELGKVDTDKYEGSFK